MDPEEARIYTAIIITCLVLGSIMIAFIISILLHQRKILTLQKENNRAEVEAREKERSRIAADLHDEIAPYISLVKLRFNEFELTKEEDIEQRELVSKVLDNSLKRLREISYDLMPAALLRKGIIAAVKDLVSHINRGNNIAIALVADNTIEFDEQKSVHLYRIVQEILQNAMKHSKASEVLIVFDRKEKLLELKIADNGVGMDYKEMQQLSTGFGLRSIRNRVELIGGKMFVTAAEGKGVSFVFEVEY